jgi:hypothetical protein
MCFLEMTAFYPGVRIRSTRVKRVLPKVQRPDSHKLATTPESRFSITYVHRLWILGFAFNDEADRFERYRKLG